MRIAIQGILCHPRRLPTELPRLPIERGLRIEFEPFPHTKFPAFATVLRAAKQGGGAVAAINAADEVLISRFLNREIAFPAISEGLRRILDQWNEAIRPGEAMIDLECLSRVDAWSRDQAQELAF
jgi:1-deoxy-D-xylulose-5-phosphate reductoisomerase